MLIMYIVKREVDMFHRGQTLLLSVAGIVIHTSLIRTPGLTTRCQESSDMVCIIVLLSNNGTRKGPTTR